jgi:hypothetical protein
MIDTERVDVNTLRDSLELTILKGKEYDFILVDAQAGTDPYAQVAASLSTLDIIVSEYDPVSAQGIDRLKILFSRELSPATTYVLFNKVLPEFASVIGEGLTIARYLPPIPWDADVVRAFAQRDLAISFEIPNTYTLAIAQIALSCAPDATGPAIEKWRGEAFYRQTDPIKKRLEHLSEIQNKLKAEESAKARRRALLDLFPAISMGLIGLVVGTLPMFGDKSPATLWGADKSIWLAATLTVAVLFLGFFQVTRETLRSEPNKNEDLQDEISKLEAAMVGAEAAFRANSPGPFAALRRHVIHGAQQ